MDLHERTYTPFFLDIPTFEDEINVVLERREPIT